jgi:dTDP-4-amino-4,6-dideoxygalactose transaminase
MDVIMKIAAKYNLFVIEDAAQAIDSYYKNRPLGSIGHMAAFSFHETKNIISGEGGMLVINDEQFIKRAEIIREKGTNRTSFFRGEVNKYGWVDIGSSFLPSDIISAFLFAQLENLDDIQAKRLSIWRHYNVLLKKLETENKIKLPVIPDYASNNAHMFYIVCSSLEERTALLDHLQKDGIYAVFHYLSLHSSPYYLYKHGNRKLPQTDYYSECLLRLPMFYDLTEIQIEKIATSIIQFYTQSKGHIQCLQ